MRFNPMRTGRYQPALTRFPTSVYPQIAGLPVQFVMGRNDDYGRIISAQGDVNNVSYITDSLGSLFEAIVNEDNAPHFEEVDWKSGIAIEGVLTSESHSAMDDLRGDLVGDFGDVEGIHFVGFVAIPYKFWKAGRDRYDLGMRRATLMRAMGKMGMLAYGKETCCWLLPRYGANNEYQMMTLCDRLSGGAPAYLESEMSFKPFPKFPLKNGMIYDFCLPWTGDSELLRVPSHDQIEDGLL